MGEWEKECQDSPEVLDPGLLDLLRSPMVKTVLRQDGCYLVGGDGERFPIEHGIPILIADRALRDHAIASVRGSAGVAATVHTGADRQHRDRTTPQGGATETIDAYRERSASYYTDNYESGNNPDRDARQQIVSRILRDRVDQSMMVLEAGSGPAVLGSQIMRLTNGYVALDLSPENLLAGRARLGSVSSICGDIRSLPFRDASFDAVTAIGCLEYVVPFTAAIQELCRVSKVGATVIATFANRASPGRWWNEFVVHRAVRSRDRRSGTPVYRRRLSSAREVTDLFAAAGARIDELAYLNPGLLGYPVSSLALTRRISTAVVRFVPALQKTGSEILVVAIRQGEHDHLGQETLTASLGSGSLSSPTVP